MKYCWATLASMLHLKYILMLPNYKLAQSYPKKGKPFAFYSQKMNITQQSYTKTEKELLYIVANLKEFRNILLGHQITVCTAHKNLTHNFYNTESLMCWRIILEEFG